MQVFAILAFLLVGFAVNFVWDRTARRGKALAMRTARREARPRALPAAPSPDAEGQGARARDPALQRFIELCRRTFTELDTLIDHFDLVLLRAHARARYGVATVHAEEPRRRGCALLATWLEQSAAFYADSEREPVRRLLELALGPQTIAEVLAREQQRASWEFRADTAPVVQDTITDLDRTVIHLQQIVRILESGDGDPYR
ncbi:MAG: hypothetical protein KC431_15840 [Myxococcales bacterium]|nr:hypothetical protein [Myxococcales bacterium]